MGERRSDLAALRTRFRHADRRGDRFVDVVYPLDLSFHNAAAVTGDLWGIRLASSRHSAPPSAGPKDISVALRADYSLYH
jgi:hypothetical protein